MRDGKTRAGSQFQISLRAAADLTKSQSTVIGLANGKYMHQVEFIMIIGRTKDFMSVVRSVVVLEIGWISGGVGRNFERGVTSVCECSSCL